MHRRSPYVGVLPALSSLSKSSVTMAASCSGVSNSQRAGVAPDARHTKTVSMMDDAVPWIWIEPPISAGHGSDAEQTRPASRIATPTA